MGSLILCHKKRAKHPYEVSRIHKHIYTIEELCYYLCNNLYLIDYTIMNEQLCHWIADELELESMADTLINVLRNQGTVEQFVLKMLEEAKIYTPGEMAHIQNVLQKLKNQKDVERQKFKADKLMESGELESAILIYVSIVNGDWDMSMDKRFYGRVYACLAAAYGKSFLYEEAANMYEKAYKLCEDESMLESYLYACSKYMPVEEYQKMVRQNQILLELDNILAERTTRIREKNNQKFARELLEEWKNAYRKE